MSRPHTPGPWEARLYEPDSAEFDDGLAAYVINPGRHDFIADVIDARNADAIAAVPELVRFVEDLASWCAIASNVLNPDLERQLRSLLDRLGDGAQLSAVR